MEFTNLCYDPWPFQCLLLGGFIGAFACIVMFLVRLDEDERREARRAASRPF